jgi:lipopolysaccharide/colanic/teichoic acid biosynthesis glycosyltransferase
VFLATQKNMQNNKNKSKKGKNVKASQASSANTVKPQDKLKRFFTVLISIIVALGLMVPVAGIGVASCSANPAQTTNPAQTSDPQTTNQE